MKSILAIMTCLQTIRYIVKMIGSPFSLEFNIERYAIDNAKRDTLGGNQPSSRNRDEWLENMAIACVDDLNNEELSGSLVPVESKPKHTLTHWRVLSFECAGKKLSIYPDGGFMNGWYIYNKPGEFKVYDLAEIMYDTEVNLVRNDEIKFDVTIEEID